MSVKLWRKAGRILVDSGKPYVCGRCPCEDEPVGSLDCQTCPSFVTATLQGLTNDLCPLCADYNEALDAGRYLSVQIDGCRYFVYSAPDAPCINPQVAEVLFSVEPGRVSWTLRIAGDRYVFDGNLQGSNCADAIDGLTLTYNADRSELRAFHCDPTGASVTLGIL